MGYSLSIAAQVQCSFRPARRDDLPSVHQLLAAIAAVQPESYAPALADLERDFDDPWANPETDSRVAVTSDGTVAAYFRLIANPAPGEMARAYLDDDIHPAHRNQGLEGPLLDWLEARGAERLREIAAANPGHPTLILRLICWDTETDRIARYERRGFKPARYSYRMRRNLARPIPERPLPPGLRLSTYQPELDERIRQAWNESFSDNWGHENISPDEWQQFMIQHSPFRPDLSFAVLDGDEVAAFSMNRFDALAAERTGFRTGWIGSLGTRRAWRKRGLASALLVESMKKFQAAGLEYAGLGVDAQNPAGAVGLYEGLGFVSYVRGITFHKIIPE
jgi:mycothiol synthase